MLDAGGHPRHDDEDGCPRRSNRVVVSGSSISMLVWPRQPGGVAYPRLLEEMLNAGEAGQWRVSNRSRVTGTILDAAADASRIVAEQPAVVTLHHGYNQAFRRPYSRGLWYFTYLSRPIPATPVRLLRSVARQYSHLRSRLRPTRNWVVEKEFRRALAWTAKYLGSKAGASVVIIGLTPWSELLESYAPGSGAWIPRYELAVREVAAVCGATYVPFRLFLQQAALSAAADIAPDGTHFSASGHLAVAQVLSRTVLSALPTAIQKREPSGPRSDS